MTIRKALWRLVRGVTWLKRRQRVETTGGVVKVNLGSGLSVVPGWMNVDGSVHAMCARWPAALLCWLYKNSDCRNTHSRDEYLRVLRQNQFVHHGLEYGVPYGDATVDFIYSSHFLEHLFREDAEALLRDAYRALKKGGRIRIAVPDLEYAVKLYQKGAKEEAMAFFFSLNGAGYLNHHHYMYDFDLLRRLLASAGFVEIEQCAFQEGQCPDVKTLDNRPEETLFVEARK
jgi:predicted SAM-dependent methyltransferase